MKNKWQIIYLLFMLIVSIMMTFSYIFTTQSTQQQISVILWTLCSVLWGLHFGLELGEWLDDKNSKN